MELTKEYFDEQLAGIATRIDGMATKDDLKGLAGRMDGLATKEDLAAAVKPLATKDKLAEAVKPLATKEGLKENFEELARMTADGFAEAAKQRSVDAIWREITDIRKVIDRMFEQMDKNIEMRVHHEEELLGLRTRVEKIENTLRGLNVQEAGL